MVYSEKCKDILTRYDVTAAACVPCEFKAGRSILYHVKLHYIILYDMIVYYIVCQ